MADNPDLSARLYSGYKSGSNSFVDVSAYAIEDNTVIANFNLPLPANWSPTPAELVVDFPIRKVLPAPIEDAQLAIINGVAYMFGGKVSNKIYTASLNNPADWTDTGATLPAPLYGASLAIVGGNIWLFGGNNGVSNVVQTGAVSTIFSAPISNPLNWTNHGSLLPYPVHYASLAMGNGQLYLFGGLGVKTATNNILQASTSNPLVWTNTGNQIPAPTYGACLAQANGSWLMYGGMNSLNNPTPNIWGAPVNNPTAWAFDGYLPYSTAFGQFITMGNDGYLIGPMVGTPTYTGFTQILQCNLSTPLAFFDTTMVVRGVISHSQLAIIYDRIWLLGGSGETAVFACNQNLKYSFTNPIVQAYANITRSVFPATDNLDNPFQALGIPYWITDYSMSPPPVAPSAPPVPPPVVPPFPPTVPQPPYI